MTPRVVTIDHLQTPPTQPENRFVEISAALWAPLVRYCIAERVTMETAVAQFVRDGLESA